MKPVFALLTVLLLSGCYFKKNESVKYTAGTYTTTASGLQYRTLQQGEGKQAKAGHKVLILESTSYPSGKVLYSNESGPPVKVLIGGNQATLAVDEGLRGMKVGEIRQLIAPPNLVKRTSYPDNVSPDSPLIIRIYLYKIL